MRPIYAMILLPFLLGACAEVGLRDLQPPSNGPDEFGIQPVKPLEAPDNFKTLPAPTPGQANLTDRNPLQEGATAFGGSLSSATGPIPASDGALVNHASRLGVTANIRQALAEKDADFRRRKARFTQIRLVPVDRYNQAYRREALDADAELQRWRRAGARTPSAPPKARNRSF